jgi:glycosyltransferase involved in cell wall biosynthesis
MAEEYSRRYGVRAVAVIPGLDPAWAVPPEGGKRHSDDLVIGMAGQLYASKEWDALLRALGVAGWKIAGRNVRIQILGRHASLSAAGETRIEFLGWAPQRGAIEKLAGADILYCPYWFSPEFEEEARLCFPSKVTTYLAAGRPILFHGPAYASPSRFLEEHDAAGFCRSLEANEILDEITRLATDSARSGSLASNGHRAFLDHLTLEKTRESFSEFLERSK